ncbi:MAG: tail fiber domain-containing protein, partial [Bacteroidetes bacterium]|nr:tail fiber domain-containing protein [Bacteroidota bacterium]
MKYFLWCMLACGLAVCACPGLRAQAPMSLPPSGAFDSLQANFLRVVNELHVGDSSVVITGHTSAQKLLYTSTGPLQINTLRAVTVNPWTYAYTHEHTYINADSSLGRVGIGTTAPTHKLHLRGQLRIDTLLTGVTAHRLLLADANGVVGSRVFTGDAADVLRGDGTFGPASDANAWRLAGNAISAGQFLGTTNAQALNVRTNNANRLIIQADGGLMAPGGSGGVPATGAGSRLMWVPTRAAVRAGNVWSTQWDLANIGFASAAFGTDVTASGETSFAAGYNSRATSAASVAMGASNQSTGTNTITIGDLNVASGTRSMVLGSTNDNAGERTLIAGYQSNATNGAPRAFLGGHNLRSEAADNVLLGSGVGAFPNQFVNNLPNTLMLGVGVVGTQPALTILANTNSGATPGRVGVGLTNPVQPLHVNGNVNIHATTQGYMIGNNTVLRVPGTNNTFVGRAAGAYTSASNVVALGHNAANTMATNGGHVVIGSQAAASMNAGIDHVIIGREAYELGNTGDGNTAMGYRAGRSTSGGVNVFVGHSAGVSNTSGHSNTFVGAHAGWVGHTGTASRCVLVGRSTAVSGNHTYATAIGNEAVVTASSTVVLGRAGSLEDGTGGDVTVCGYTSMPIPGGGNWLGTPFGINRLGVNGNILAAGGLYYASDSRVKRNVGELEGALEKLERLNPVTFEYDTLAPMATHTSYEKTDSLGRVVEVVQVKHAFPLGRQTGFIAQEVEKVLPEAVVPGTDSTIYFMNGTALIPLLTQALKEQHAEVKELRMQLAQLEQRLNSCCAQGSYKTAPETESESINRVLEKQLELPYLAQNKPNPTSGETLISYYVPTTAGTAYIEMIDMQGRIVKTIPVRTGEGSYTLPANALKAGTYTYTLVLDN